MPHGYVDVAGLIVNRGHRDASALIAALREREPGTPEWRHELFLKPPASDH